MSIFGDSSTGGIHISPVTFAKIAERHPPTDKARYASFYANVLQHVASTYASPVRMLEMGIGQNAASLRMWREIFGSKAHLVGIDIDTKYVQAARQVFDCPQGDALPAATRAVEASFDDLLSMQSVADSEGPFNLVVDDGSHYAKHIHQCFRVFWPKLSPGGIYVIEDLETNNRPKYHKQYSPKPLDWIMEMMKQDCTGKAFEQSHLYYLSRNIVAIVRKE